MKLMKNCLKKQQKCNSPPPRPCCIYPCVRRGGETTGMHRDEYLNVLFEYFSSDFQRVYFRNVKTNCWGRGG